MGGVMGGASSYYNELEINDTSFSPKIQKTVIQRDSDHFRDELDENFMNIEMESLFMPPSSLISFSSPSMRRWDIEEEKCVEELHQVRGVPWGFVHLVKWDENEFLACHINIPGILVFKSGNNTFTKSKTILSEYKVIRLLRFNADTLCVIGGKEIDELGILTFSYPRLDLWKSVGNFPFSAAVRRTRLLRSKKFANHVYTVIVSTEIQTIFPTSDLTDKNIGFYYIVLVDLDKSMSFRRFSFATRVKDIAVLVNSHDEEILAVAEGKMISFINIESRATVSKIFSEEQVLRIEVVNNEYLIITEERGFVELLFLKPNNKLGEEEQEEEEDIVKVLGFYPFEDIREKKYGKFEIPGETFELTSSHLMSFSQSDHEMRFVTSSPKNGFMVIEVTDIFFFNSTTVSSQNLVGNKDLKERTEFLNSFILFDQSTDAIISHDCVKVKFMSNQVDEFRCCIIFFKSMFG